MKIKDREFWAVEVKGGVREFGNRMVARQFAATLADASYEEVRLYRCVVSVEAVLDEVVKVVDR